jgi:hypothetical protein
MRQQHDPLAAIRKQQQRDAYRRDLDKARKTELIDEIQAAIDSGELTSAPLRTLHDAVEAVALAREEAQEVLNGGAL